MKYFLTLLLLSGCATTKVPLEVTGIWEFNFDFTYQSLYDDLGGIRPVDSIGGDLYIPPRYEYHFTEKYFDFDRKELVVVGYLDNGEVETTKTVPFTIGKQTFDYVMVSYTTYYGEFRTEKLNKTYGCYYIENESNFYEYYCPKEVKI